MDNPESPQAPAPLRDAVAEARSVAQEQVTVLWQMQVDRVRDALDAGWREPLERVFAERFADIESRLTAEFDQALERYREQFRTAELARENERAAAASTERLNQTARRMKQAENREVWIQTLLERAADFCGRAALFAVKGRTLRYEGGLSVEQPESGLDVALENAAAFRSAVEAKDTTVTAPTAGELSEEVARLVGASPEKRAYLFPLLLRSEVVGVLYAEDAGRGVDVNGLELIAALAERTFEPEPAAAAPAEAIVQIAAAAAAPGARWTNMPAADQELHARAERFARSRVAELMLYHIPRVKQGRAVAGLYDSLREEIDAGRAAYREQFLNGPASVPDYYHAELVRTVARGDASLLGPAYPGPLS